MKRVIFLLLVPFIFLQCTDELQEIDGVIAASDIKSRELTLEAKDVPLNAFTSFYHHQENQNVVINKDTTKMINLSINDLGQRNSELSGVWEGDFEFLNGEYEFTYFTDNRLKIMVGDMVLYDGTSTENMEQKRITQSIEGIRRLKVFYNMSGSQKLQQIINYYNSLNNTEQDDDAKKPVHKTAQNGQGNNTPDLSDLKLYLNWHLIHGN